MSLSREAHDALRVLAFNRAMESGTRINVSAVIADLAREAAARHAAGTEPGL
jgi:hypothetical protein